MSNFWRELFESRYIKPEKKLTLREVELAAEESYLGFVGTALYAFHDDASDFNVDRMDVQLSGHERAVAAARACFDYAVNGRITLSIDPQVSEQQDDLWKCLTLLVATTRLGAEMYAPTVKSRGIGVPVQLEHLFFQAIIRARLDIDTNPSFIEASDDSLPAALRQDTTGYLTLKEVAVLAQMADRAVRNAAQPTAADQLITQKQGHQTVVDSHEALRWLKRRRGFTPTATIESNI
nr:hypothetical protein [Pseudomonas luteola]